MRKLLGAFLSGVALGGISSVIISGMCIISGNLPAWEMVLAPTVAFVLAFTIVVIVYCVRPSLWDKLHNHMKDNPCTPLFIPDIAGIVDFFEYVGYFGWRDK